MTGRLRMASAALALAAAGAAGHAVAAEQRLSAAEFEAYVTGRTLYYSTAGQEAYGAEEYRPGRRVIWTFLDGDCVEGFWYERDEGLICFVYEAAIETQCWSFWRGGKGISARFENDPGAMGLFELRQSEKPLTCRGPEVGV